MSDPAAITVIMITLNEAHNLPAVLENLQDFAAEIFVLDSYSVDSTVDIALAGGVHVVQRKFQGFGDQWDYAVTKLPASQPWTMKLDPDERLSNELKLSIRTAIQRSDVDAFTVSRRLWFMGRALPITQVILRGWRTGTARFEHVAVNEHPLVPGRVAKTEGDLAHFDSPNLHHWFAKQNAYSTAEAEAADRSGALAAQPRLFGNELERRMWLKAIAFRLPILPTLFFLYYFVMRGAWKAGRVGFEWSRLRGDVYRMVALKRLELRLSGRPYVLPAYGHGQPDLRVNQASE